MEGRVIAVSLIIVLGVGTGAQDSNSSTDGVDRREQVLLYGIETDVLTVIADLTGEKIDTYNDLLTSVLNQTRDPQIAQSIFRLWDETSYEYGEEIARQELAKVLDDFDYSVPVVQSAMAYLANRKDTDSMTALLEMSEHQNSAIAASAVRALGKIGLTGTDLASPEVLLERLIESDPVAEEDLVAALIVTLGELAYAPASDELVLIVEDTGSSMGHRRLASMSVGKIGRPEDYPIIERVYYESDDAMLRSYALAGLAEFPEQDTTAILVQALKRDPFWRIRVTAAEKLAGERDEEVAELLRYKAGNDPVNQVRIAALRSLGTLANNRTRRFLLDFFQDDSRSTETRLASLNVLLENKIPETPDAINTVMDALWEKDQGRFLEFTGREISRASWKALAPLYERMLDHQSWLLQVYAIRGIRRNSIDRLNARIEALDVDGADGRVRREIDSGN